jgi:hypothetical protein
MRGTDRQLVPRTIFCQGSRCGLPTLAKQNPIDATRRIRLAPAAEWLAVCFSWTAVLLGGDRLSQPHGSVVPTSEVRGAV